MHNAFPRLPLPDVAFDAVPLARPLDWVGMDGMTLPVRVDGADGVPMLVPAAVDVAVNLRDPAARGIHMSRLYLRLQQALVSETLGAPTLRRLLDACVASQEGLADRARLRLRFDRLLLRRALRSDNAGWKRYPVEIEAELAEGHLRLTLGFAVEYSSTCPASAALARQAIAQRFSEEFAVGPAPPAAAVRDWLESESGMIATPHAQRSRAELRVELRPAFDELPLEPLIDAVEAALGTPVQTAVKREDEQAFALANGANLMFCEDAARRISAVLAGDARVAAWSVRAAHLESLHPHDAVASASGRNPA
ncbi:MAG: GTP cyclohydrolase FolE2 [Thermomonas sp.]|uniref:GTP cyclohydrolase FolE2 n=1 Tax=Thermomonas sp. TaxID=1971895 RepID=UPI001D23E92A|nr:GTP cyclohydrolase FolE2 [Thermomonas sp.]MBZ0087572.1 GTP cyclohydrolase FolE2 [Thermomonas sp.]